MQIQIQMQQSLFMQKTFLFVILFANLGGWDTNKYKYTNIIKYKYNK